MLELKSTTLVGIRMDAISLCGGISQIASLCLDVVRALKLTFRDSQLAFTDFSRMKAELRVLDQKRSQLAAFMDLPKDSSDGRTWSAICPLIHMQYNAMGYGKQAGKQDISRDTEEI